jgi:hypothetical protein
MGAVEARRAIVGALAAEFGESAVVYSAPPETVTAPALVVAPRTPYRNPSTFCQYELNLRIVALVQRGVGGLDGLDDMMDRVLIAVNTLDSVMWTAVGDIGTTQDVGSIEYLTASIDIIAYV